MLTKLLKYRIMPPELAAPSWKQRNLSLSFFPRKRSSKVPPPKLNLSSLVFPLFFYRQHIKVSPRVVLQVSAEISFCRSLPPLFFGSNLFYSSLHEYVIKLIFCWSFPFSSPSFVPAIASFWLSASCNLSCLQEQQQQSNRLIRERTKTGIN